MSIWFPLNLLVKKFPFPDGVAFFALGAYPFAQISVQFFVSKIFSQSCISSASKIVKCKLALSFPHDIIRMVCRLVPQSLEYLRDACSYRSRSAQQRAHSRDHAAVRWGSAPSSEALLHNGRTWRSARCEF